MSKLTISFNSKLTINLFILKREIRVRGYEIVHVPMIEKVKFFINIRAIDGSVPFDPPFPVFSSGVLSLFLVRWISIRHFVRSRFTSPPLFFIAVNHVSFSNSVRIRLAFLFLPQLILEPTCNVFRKQRALFETKEKNFEEVDRNLE